MEKSKHLESQRLIYLLAFFIPIIILIFIYILRGIYPFGDQCFLRSDMYHQYAPFLAAFQDKIKHGGSLAYSWDIGMGVNFTALYAYYLASPVNWILIIFPQKYLIELMSVFIILKIGLAGFTFSYYICKHYHTSNLAVAALSVFYSLSAYICAYSWNLMWLDCIWLLPLILLGLERLIREDKCILYCVSLGLCILSNYYIAIMVCIFCVLYFILQMIAQPRIRKRFLEKCLNFGLYSLLAGGFCAFLLLPEFFALQLTVSGDIKFPSSLSRYFSILEMMSRQLMIVEPAIFSAHEPNIYTGMLIFLLIPLYALNTRTNIKEKVGKFFLVFLFYLSFNLNIPNYIWHGFHFPNSLPCRQSFIFSFLLLTMAYEGFKDLRGYNPKEILTIFSGSVILILIMEQLFVTEDFSYAIIYVSILFLSLYALLFHLYNKKRISPKLSCILLFICVISEAFINTTVTSVNTTGRSAYVKDNPAITKLLSDIAETDTGFYRVEKLKRRTKNDSAWHHYRGVSIFSSTANAGFGEFLANMGGEKSTNSYSYYGSTPLTEALLSIKYILSNEELPKMPNRTLITQEDSVYLYQNSYTLPLGFLVPRNLHNDWKMNNPNPFIVQNEFANLAGNISPLFVPVDFSNGGNSMQIYVDSDQQVYVYVTSGGEDFTATYENENGETEVYPTKKFTGINHKYIMDLGYCKAGTIIHFSTTDNDVLQAYVYALNQENFEDLYQTLSSQVMTVKSFDETYITAEVTAKETCKLLTSIMYEKGWSVTVDGKKVETIAFQDALLAIPLSPGTHQLEFRYRPYGLMLGIIISLITLTIFLIICFFKWRKSISSVEFLPFVKRADKVNQSEE